MVREFLSTIFAAWTVFISFGFISAAAAWGAEDFPIIAYISSSFFSSVDEIYNLIKRYQSMQGGFLY